MEDFKGEAGQGLCEAVLSGAADVHPFVLAEELTKQEALLSSHHTIVQHHLSEAEGEYVSILNNILLRFYDIMQKKNLTIKATSSFVSSMRIDESHRSSVIQKRQMVHSYILHHQVLNRLTINAKISG